MAHRVMVVDDDPDIRSALLDIFTDHGYEVICASNGREALQKLEEAGKSQLPCIIFLDLMMPVMDGVAFRQELLCSPQTAAIPVVILTAYRDASEAAPDLQAAMLLNKPIEMRDLVGAAQAYCKGGTAVC